jgi:Kef-type K+ transport system membrane component KefB
VFAAFVGIALAISSLPVAARILADLGLLRRPVGRLVLAVAMSNDVVGWLLLGVVVSMAEDGRLSAANLGVACTGLAAVVVLVPLFGPVFLDRVHGAVERRGGGPAAWAAIALLFTASIGALTHALGLEVVIGAFVAGIAIGRSRLRSEPVMGQLEIVSAAIFVPLFFAVAGLRVDLTELLDPMVLAWSIVICATAVAAKLIGSRLGGRVGGLDPTTAAIAAGALNARGALEIVVATVGLSIAVLSDASYSAIVAMAIVTSAITAPLIRRADRTVDPPSGRRAPR